MIFTKLLLEFENDFKHFERLERSVFLLKVIFSNSLNLFDAIFESLKFLLKINTIGFPI